MIGKWLRNESPVFRAKDHRDEFRRMALGIINLESNELPFPIHPPSLARHFMATEPAIISLGADQKNKLGPV